MLNGKTICTVCNYIHDEVVGELAQNILPSVKFTDLPGDWQCPECGSAKDMFQPCSCVSLPTNEQTCAVHRDYSNPINACDSSDEITQSSRNTPVGQLVAQRPSRACVLEQYGIDYCCSGKTTLEEACQKKGLQVQDILEKLFAADRKEVQPNSPDWTKIRLKELVNHIITTYHQPLRQELSRIAQLADKVARVHGDNHPEMVEVLNVFNCFKTQLELHMQKEETILFPGIVSLERTGELQVFGCGGGIEHPIEMMSKEHDDAGEAFCAMRRLTHDYTPPNDACSSFKVLLYSLAQIESEMHEHVHKENNILFPRSLSLANQTQHSDKTPATVH